VVTTKEKGQGERRRRRFGFGLLNLNISVNVCCLEDITLILQCLLHERNSDAVKQQPMLMYENYCPFWYLVFWMIFGM